MCNGNIIVTFVYFYFWYFKIKKMLNFDVWLLQLHSTLWYCYFYFRSNYLFHHCLNIMQQ